MYIYTTYGQFVLVYIASIATKKDMTAWTCCIILKSLLYSRCTETESQKNGPTEWQQQHPQIQVVNSSVYPFKSMTFWLYIKKKKKSIFTLTVLWVYIAFCISHVDPDYDKCIFKPKVNFAFPSAYQRLTMWKRGSERKENGKGSFYVVYLVYI